MSAVPVNRLKFSTPGKPRIAGLILLIAFVSSASVMAQTTRPATLPAAEPKASPMAFSSVRMSIFMGRELDGIKPMIGATDEEWMVIGPKLRNVWMARQTVVNDQIYADPGSGVTPPLPTFAPPPPTTSPASNRPAWGNRPRGRDNGPGFASFFRGGIAGPPGTPFNGGFGGRGFGPFGRNDPIGSLRLDLLAVLGDPKQPESEIRDRLQTLRAARIKARADLEAAQNDLQPLLTIDQEAILVELGYLD